MPDPDGTEPTVASGAEPGEPGLLSPAGWSLTCADRRFGSV